MKYQYYSNDINKLADLSINEFFVFGSNLAGRHGKGAALFAKEYLHAETNICVGFTGYCYAIPTKDYNLKTLSLNDIDNYVKLFKTVALNHEFHKFYVTKIGCGLAGYKDSDIAPLFIDSPINCKFHEDWKKYLE